MELLLLSPEEREQREIEERRLKRQRLLHRLSGEGAQKDEGKKQADAPASATKVSQSSRPSDLSSWSHLFICYRVAGAVGGLKGVHGVVSRWLPK